MIRLKSARTDRPRGGRHLRPAAYFVAAAAAFGAAARGQEPPYADRPAAEPPIYRVRYEAAQEPGGLTVPATFTAWIPDNVPTLRGVIVHQHGCGEGSCRSGLTGAHDLHWQAVARKHDCALIAPAYEQPEEVECQRWCDPRNGSGDAFLRALADLGRMAHHPELATVPWVLWGHSGGGHWAGGMTMLHPERVVAAWLRSGVPLFEANPKRPNVRPHLLPEAAIAVPMLCNPGTQEGVSVTDGPFAAVWPATQAFFAAVRSRGGLIGVAIDPLSSHECGNQRYLAIRWIDACLTARLGGPGDPMRPMPVGPGWLAAITGSTAVPAAAFDGDELTAGWLPDAATAQAWMEYVKDTAVADATPPPAPTDVCVAGGLVTWRATADPESGLAGFTIERDGLRLPDAPTAGANPHGRTVFQGLQYSDTPVFPLVQLQFTDATAVPGARHRYRVIARNTAGLESPPSEPGRETP
jgi:hypothetical protein